MQCVVTGGNVKVLGKALHSLSRIGDELYVEPQEDGLALRSVNSSRSAYACFLFAPLFFSRYSIPSGLNFRCKMAIKEVVVISVKPLSFLLQIVAANLTEYNLPFYTYSVLTVFRSLATLEKTVEKCHISLDEQKDRLTFTLHCKHGLLKTHNLSYQDSESLEAVFDKDNCANVFRAQPRVLVDTVVHFTTSLEEVTVTVSDERMWVRNHVEDDAERSKAMLTELCLAADEFDYFAVKSHNSITFCLKEFRGLLLFAESTGLPVSMYLDEPGSPVVLSVTDSVLEGNFVLATLSDDHSLHKSNRGADAEQLQPPDDFMNDDMDAYLIAMDTSVAPGPSTADAPTSSLATSRKPPAPNYRTRTYSEEEENGEEDPGRPPDKKFRSLFFGSVLPPSPQMSTQPVTSQEVLASDSEDETEAE